MRKFTLVSFSVTLLIALGADSTMGQNWSLPADLRHAGGTRLEGRPFDRTWR